MYTLIKLERFLSFFFCERQLRRVCHVSEFISFKCGFFRLISMASKEQDNPSGFSTTFPPKRQKLVKCIICQVDKEEILRKGKGSSGDTLNRALDLCKDEVYDRLHKDLPNFLNQDVLFVLH